MKRRNLAAAHFVLVFPAVLFMAALIGRSLPPDWQMAQAAHHVVSWYSGRIWTLWVLLLALPLSVVFSGVASFWCSAKDGLNTTPGRAQTIASLHNERAALCVAITTIAAGLILSVVILHMLGN